MSRPFITALSGLDAFRSVQSRWNIAWREQSAGTNTNGNRFVDIGNLPRWVGVVELKTDETDILDVRLLHNLARGRTATWRICMNDPIGYAGSSTGTVTWSNGATWGNGAYWGIPPTVALTADVAVGDTSIKVDETGLATPIKQGAYLSYEDWPFLVAWRTGTGADVELGVEMPIRKAMTAGEGVNLAATGIFELVESDPLAVGYDANRFSRPQWRFQEVLNR